MTLAGRIPLVLLIIISTILFWNNEYGLIITALISYFYIIVGFIIQRIKIKSPKNLAIRRIYKNKIWEYVKLGFGILFIVWGYFENRTSNNVLNINSLIVFGVFIFLLWLFNSSEYLIFITDKAIFLYDSDEVDKWKIKKIDEVVIKENKIEFYLGRERHKYVYENIDPTDAERIECYLLPRIQERIQK